MNSTNTLVATGVALGAGLLGILPVQGDNTVPYHSKTVGQITYAADGGVLIEETGKGNQLGNFELKGETGALGYIWLFITAANGDNVFGVVVGGSGNTIELDLFDGTGRFVGVTGHITATITPDPNPVSTDPLTLSYTATTTGSLSTVGSNK